MNIAQRYVRIFNSVNFSAVSHLRSSKMYVWECLVLEMCGLCTPGPRQLNISCYILHFKFSDNNDLKEKVKVKCEIMNVNLEIRSILFAFVLLPYQFLLMKRDTD